MNKLKNALARFVYGRYMMYAANDRFNKFLQFLIIALLVIDLFFINSIVLSVVVLVLLVYQMFRLFSKNIPARRNEDTKFRNLFKPITKRRKLMKKAKQDATHKYFMCPKCSQNVRVPKGKGKITITCPKCKHKFDKRS